MNEELKAELLRRWRYLQDHISGTDGNLEGESWGRAADSIGKLIREAELCEHDCRTLRSDAKSLQIIKMQLRAIDKRRGKPGSGVYP